MVTIRKAVPSDAETIYNLILEIADYEKLSHEVQNSVEKIEEHFFGEHPKVFALLVEKDQEVIGYAIYFYNYSTFVGKHGLYLEDFYLKEPYRRQGIGKHVFSKLIQISKEEDLGRMEWVVLDWNQPAINFYNTYDAKPMDDWILMRLDEQQIKANTD